ncbi:MAG TPA: carboxypeptidase M32 [Firmicutes bacterium]|nr:carboxypeptidase M32 [Bacillota bacterium]
MSAQWNRFLELMGEMVDLAHMTALAGWDQQVMMPSRGAEERGRQIATLERYIHKLLTGREFGDLLSALEEEVEAKGTPYESREASLIRKARREFDKAVRLPEQLVSEMAQAESLAFNAWVEAKSKADFRLFEPHLSRLVELQKAKAEALGYKDTPYDALLDNYEPGMTSKDLEELFSELRAELTPLVAQIARSRSTKEHLADNPLRQYYAEKGQMDLCRKILDILGFDGNKGRMDKSAHPFTTQIGRHDIRLTIRTRTNDLASAVFCTLHEGGHALYEQGLPDTFKRTFLGQGASLGVHESQSRLWENVIGRSRLFWQHFLPVAREIFPSQLAGVGIDRIYKAVNLVEPSLVRVDADEVTYNLHIIMRYEIERALLEGELAVADLPAVWWEKMEKYLGIKPANDAEGVLQDVHWAQGYFGYFPTYTLGSVFSVQLWQAACRKEADLAVRLEKGDFSVVREWLNKEVHAWGASLTMQELALKVTGKKLTIKPYIKYLKNKYSKLYDLAL